MKFLPLMRSGQSDAKSIFDCLYDCLVPISISGRYGSEAVDGRFPVADRFGRVVSVSRMAGFRAEGAPVQRGLFGQGRRYKPPVTMSAVGQFLTYACDALEQRGVARVWRI